MSNAQKDKEPDNRSFSTVFKLGTVANYRCAKRLWDDRDSVTSKVPSTGQGIAFMTSVGAATHVGKRRIGMKCRNGREKKITPWVVTLESELVSGFDMLRNLT